MLTDLPDAYGMARGLHHGNYQTVHCINNYYTSGSFSSLTRCEQQHKYIHTVGNRAHTACFYLQVHYITTSQLKRFLRRNKNVSRGKGKNIMFEGERERIWLLGQYMSMWTPALRFSLMELK